MIVNIYTQHVNEDEDDGIASVGTVNLHHEHLFAEHIGVN